jgi:hypothetical protein
MDIKEIGAICKYYRIKVLNLSLTEFAKRNNENLQNIHAFEKGRANNIKYLYMYMKQSNIYQLEILLYNLFYDGIKE